MRIRACFAAALLAVTSVKAAAAARHPQYGGTLRVELRAAKVSLDPRAWKPGSYAMSMDAKLAALVYDRLVTLDDYGRFQPALATEWSHDSGKRRWQFKLRPGVKFSDGTPLRATDVSSALLPLLPEGLQIATNGDAGVTIHGTRPIADLLEQLATGPYFVYRAVGDGTLQGTGPFSVAESGAADAAGASNPNKPMKLKFKANEESWEGRPFLDAIEVTLGQPALRQVLDLQVGKTDIADVSPDLVRKARYENVKIWKSAPKILLALRFDDAQMASGDARLREALAGSLDRGTMASVLLQKQAEPAATLLPQWLSGYAFLFDSPLNLEHAKELRTSLPANEAGGNEPLRLRVDANGELWKMLGERVVINARQANLAVQVAPVESASVGKTGLHLLAWHYGSVSPRAELEAMAKQWNLQDSGDAAGNIVTDLEQLEARERWLLEDRWIVPLVVVPEFTGVGVNVRNWRPSPWGDWRLADVWLAQPENGQEHSAAGAKGQSMKRADSAEAGAQP